MIDKLFFVVLVLNATGLFSFVAPQLGVSIGQVSLGLLMLNVFYLVVKSKHTTPLLFRGESVRWLLVLVLWPLSTVAYAPSIEIRMIGLLLYHFSIFFGAVVYTIANGLPAMYRVLSVSLIITIIGLVLSMLMPGYFEAVAALGRHKTDYMGRAFGFSMQPNSLAVSIGFLFLAWFALWKGKNAMLEVGAILAFLLVMLLTGSRTGMLVGALTVTLHLAYQWRMWLKGKSNFRYPHLKTLALSICIIGGVVGTRVHLGSLGENAGRSEGDLIDRMDALLRGRLSFRGNVMDDVSVQERFGAQEAYWSLIAERPVLGHGFGSDAYYRENGFISTSAHSDALTCAMEYGALYPFVFGLMVFQLYRNHNRRDMEGVLRTNSICQIVAVIMFLFTIAGGLAFNRTFYVVLGGIFAAICFPRYVFSCDENTGRICAWMTRHEIAKRYTQRRIGRKTLRPLAPAQRELAQRRG